VSGKPVQPGGCQAWRPAASCLDAVGGSARPTSNTRVSIGAPPGIRLPGGEDLSGDLPSGGYAIRLAGRRRDQGPFSLEGVSSSGSLSSIRSRLRFLHSGPIDCHVRIQLFPSPHAAAKGLEQKLSETSIPSLARRVKLKWEGVPHPVSSFTAILAVLMLKGFHCVGKSGCPGGETLRPRRRGLRLTGAAGARRRRGRETGHSTAAAEWAGSSELNLTSA